MLCVDKWLKEIHGYVTTYTSIIAIVQSTNLICLVGLVVSNRVCPLCRGDVRAGSNDECSVVPNNEVPTI